MLEGRSVWMCSCSRQWCVGRKGCESVDVLLLKAVVCWKEECESVDAAQGSGVLEGM